MTPGINGGFDLWDWTTFGILLLGVGVALGLSAFFPEPYKWMIFGFTATAAGAIADRRIERIRRADKSARGDEAG